MRLLCRLLVAAVVASPIPEGSAQTLSIGAAGGLGLTSDYGGTGTTVQALPGFGSNTVGTWTTYTSRPTLVAGPKLEVQFTERISLEIDALRRPRRKGFQAIFSPPIVINSEVFAVFSSTSAETTWEVPLLVKYRLPGFSERRPVRPFVEAGPSLRPWLYDWREARAGITGGIGLQFRVGSLRIEPTIRYTRWGAEQTYVYSSTPAKRDQLEFLVGAAADSSSFRPTVFGRRLSAGILGGFGLSGDFPEKEGWTSARSKLVGLALESAISERLSVEFDALYRPRILSERQRATVLTWEFPVLAKYKFRSTPHRRPFVALGPSLRSSGNTNGTNPSRYGVTAGLGFEAKLQMLRFAPAVRYTRWAADPPAPFSPGSTIRNQVDVVVGFLF
jgi:hypothetical protein